MNYIILALFFSIQFAAAEEPSLTHKQQEEAHMISTALIKRDALVSEVETLTRTISEKKSLLSERGKLESELVEAEKRLAEAEAVVPPDALLVEKLKSKLTDIRSALDSTTRVSATEIQMLEDDVKRKNSQISILLGSITGQFSGEQSFRRGNSINFSILIGLVIVGFFALAFIDTQVRSAIFGGDSGIQFVALFSLIIAIILFGISGILEGKELSALLGGLSGYILGRNNIGRAPQLSTGSNKVIPEPAGIVRSDKAPASTTGTQ